MIGLLTAILLSWILLWLLDRSSLEKLGLRPTKQRTISLVAGLMISVLCALIYFGSKVYLSNSNLAVNNTFSLSHFFTSLWWVTKSVLFEEFLFRGALLYSMIKYLGSKVAVILSGIAFGVYHWFSYGVFGNIGPMITIFILTATVGLLLAYCFVRTKSMYLQTGLHLGWNVVTIIVFSQGPLGKQFLIASNGHEIGTVLSILLFLFQIICLPILTIYYLDGNLKKAFPNRNSS